MASTGKRSGPDRPLSPHLQIYKPQITSALSIFHRMSGIVLAGGALLLICWLLALARGPEAYAGVQAFATSWIGMIIIIGWTLAFFYHLCNGIRHLMWDAGYGFELETVTRSGIAVLLAAVILTALVCWFGISSWS